MRILTPIVLLGCGEQVISKQENSAPTVLLVSHSDGAEVQEGYAESFRATVSDDDNDFSELQAVWYVGEEIVCDWAELSPAGDTTCQIVFEPDDNNVIVEVRDPQGSGGRAEVSVVVTPTEAPAVELLTPEAGSAYYSNHLIQFSALVSDNEDASEDLLISWTSSIDGELVLDTTPDSSGLISDYTYLSEGQHAIELRVEDSSNKVSTAEVVLQVGGENTAPLCEITEPSTQTAVNFGTPVVFIGTATDDDIPNTDLSVEWISDKDGSLGTSTPSSAGVVSFAYSDLSIDIHTISMNVTDEIGTLCSAQILLTIGTPPTAVITEPNDGDVFSLGEPVVFQAEVSDQENQPSEISVEWVSSVDGSIHSSAANSQGISQFFNSDLSAGLHSISMTATDSSGLIVDDLITIRINNPPTSPTITLSPDPVYSADSLAVTASGSTDADGDNISYSYEWYENGILTSQTGVMVSSSDLDVGEVWTVRVTPNDGYIDGNYAEASISISNSEPVISSVLISSSDGSDSFNDSTLTCLASATDVDETVTPSYLWDINGTMVVGASVDLSSYNVLPGDSVTCTASVTDSNGGTASSSASESIDNRDPQISSVSISPSLAMTDSLLSCSSSETDLDGESLNTTYEWFIGSSSVGTGTQFQLDNSLVSPGIQVNCTVTAEDASGGTAQDTASVIIGNTDPVVGTITLTPSEPTLDDTLSCVSSATDADGDTPTLSFSFINQTSGAIYSPSSTTSNSASLDLTSNPAQYDDVIACEVTATDANGGTASDIATVMIVNTAPVFDQEAEITPNTGVVTGTELTCSAVASDPDDGVASLSYTWQVSGTQVGTGPSWTVNTSDANVGDSIICSAIAIDFEGNTTVSASSPVLVENTAPEIDSLSLNTTSPDTVTQLEATISTSDLDGDTVSLTLEWHVIDVSGTDSIVLTSTGSSPVLPDSFFERDEEVYVIVTPFDGTDSGTAVESDHAFVLNTAPTQPTISLTSLANPPMEGVDDLTCTVTGVSTDLDGDTIEYTYEWFDGSGASVLSTTTTGTYYTYLGVSTSSGMWTCTVTASDGTDVSASASAQILVDTDWAGILTFTNCGNSGRSGPSQSACNSEYSGTLLDGFVTVTSGYQYWTVVDSGVYEIEVGGAQGGSSGSYPGGEGAVMVGEFNLSAGDQLEILVGQRGTNSTNTNDSGHSGGGGGGTFIALNGSPLIVAGGGGGAGVSDTCSNSTIQGLPGQSTQLGVKGQGSACTNHATSPGQGGGGDFCGTGASMGAGYYGDSPDYSSGSWATGADAFVNGGLGSDQRTNGGDGGFGGGGGGAYGGGGGGGYSGGGTGHYNSPCRDQGGGGGGSYNIGSNPINTTGGNTGFGYVIIDKL